MVASHGRERDRGDHQDHESVDGCLFLGRKNEPRAPMMEVRGAERATALATCDGPAFSSSGGLAICVETADPFPTPLTRIDLV